MSFQIKDFASITASQINHARAVTKKITDYQPGSVARTIMEAPAVEIEELYLQMFLGLRDAIPVATFRSFGFEKLPAAHAVGYVSVSAETPLAQEMSVPAGTVFHSTDGREYQSTHEVTWPAGSGAVLIPVMHAVAGAVGNAAAGSVTLSSFFGGGYTISSQPIGSGRDLELDAEREARFASFVQSISRGTLTACAYAARQSVVLGPDGDIVEYVTRLGVDEQPGHVRLFVYSSHGSPSLALLESGQRRIDGWTDPETGAVTPGYRAAGVRIDVLGMTERQVPLSIRVDMLEGYQLTAAVQQSIRDIFSAQIRSVFPGQTLYLGSLIEAMLATAGVRAIVPSTSENIVCEINEALIPGELTITSL